MAFAAPVGISSPSRAATKHSQYAAGSSSPVRPSSPYGTSGSPSRVHSPCATRALHQAAGRLSHSSSSNSLTGLAPAVHNTVRQLQGSPLPRSISFDRINVRGTSHLVHSSSGNQPAEWHHLQRPTSPVSTFEPSSPTVAAAATIGTAAGHDDGLSAEDQALQTTGSAAVASPAAAVLPSVDVPAGSTAKTAAAAEAQAAVSATMSYADLSDQQSAEVEQQLQARLQDLLALLRFQVSNGFPETAVTHTLIGLVKFAATDQTPLAAIMAPDNLSLWKSLLVSDPQIAVLAAEVLCRVCSQDLKPWTPQLTELLPALLHVVKHKGSSPPAAEGVLQSSSTEDAGANPAAGKQIPLVFFTVSALVRMSGVRGLAAEIVKQGGVQELIGVLTVGNPAICQVTTFSLFRLMREIDGDLSDEQLIDWPAHSTSSSDHSSTELLLVQYVKQGAFSKLCRVLGEVDDGSAHDLAFSMLLSMSIVPEVAQLVADRNDISQIVKVLTSSTTASTRLEAMLVLARLSARHTPCQQDAVREGAVPVLVQLMQEGNDEERCHSARLLAILGQHASTHQILLDSGALSAALQVIRDRGHQRQYNNIVLIPVQASSHASDGKPLGIWEAAQAIYNTAVAAGLSGAAASSAAAAGVAAAVAETNNKVEQQREALERIFNNSSAGSTASAPPLPQQHQQREAQAPAVADQATQGRASSSKASSKDSSAGGKKKPSTSSSTVSSTNGGAPIGPAMVLEQAAGVVCMLSHNLDNHFKMVGEGTVPLLVSLLSKDTLTKTLSYTLASLLMLAVGEPRHAAVIARTGAVPGLVSVAGDAAVRPNNREMAAALLAVLCRSRDVQEEVVASGGISELVRLVTDGSEGGRCYGCEALSQIAAASDERARQVLRAQVLEPLRDMLQPECTSQSVMWASKLLQVLSKDATCLREICAMPGLIPLVPEVFSRQPAVSAPASAAAAPSKTLYTDKAGLPLANQSAGSQSAEGSRTAVMPEIPDVDVLSSLSSRDSDDESSPKAGRRAEGAGGKDSDLEKAQSSMAWLVAALATNSDTRPVIAELGNFLVKPLVIILRDAQGGQGSGYTLTEVLEGIRHSRQAAAVAALRAMSRADDRLAAAINAEITVQLWMGHRVELPPADDEWPFDPNWYVKDN